MVSDLPGVFAGGDCVTGPATVIRAIAAGKVAAANIDNYLGFNHLISVDVDIPAAISEDKHHCARVNLGEKDAQERKDNFEHIECGMTDAGSRAGVLGVVCAAITSDTAFSKEAERRYGKRDNRRRARERRRKHHHHGRGARRSACAFRGCAI